MQSLNSQQKDFKAYVSEVSDGNMSFVWGEEQEVRSNRQELFKKASTDERSISIVQLEHGDEVKYIDESLNNSLEKESGDKIIADAISTDKRGLGLMLLVADCIPAVLYDQDKKAISIIHAGRKGVELNILGKTIEWMHKKYGTEASDLLLFSGPCIGKESYVFDSIVDIDTVFWGEYLRLGQDNKHYMDIIGKFKQQGQEAGLVESQINLSEIDTYQDKRYFSHRRSMATGETEGRFALLACIAE